MMVIIAIKEFLGLRRNVALLLAAIVMFAAGEEMWMRFVPKYLEALGAPVLAIGVFDALKTFLGAAYALPGGLLSDAWGSRRALLFFSWISIVGYVILFAVPHWGAVLGATFLFLGWSALSLPASFSVVGESLPANKQAMGIGVQSLVKRIPIMVGPVIGGLLMDRMGIVPGFRAGVAICIVIAIAAALLQGFMRDSGAIAGSESYKFIATLRSFPPALRRLLVSDILIRFCERIPYAWVVIYAMDQGGLSASEVGLLVTIEMLTAIVCFLPVAHLADRYGKEPFVLATFVFFTLFPLALIGARGFWMLALAFVVRGLKEFGDPARKALILGLSSSVGRGRGVGTYYFVRDSVVTVGSFVGAALWTVSPEANFLVAAGVGAVGTLFYLSQYRLERR